MTGGNWRPRLVALDVDGTLLETGGAIRPSVRTAVRDAVTAGAHVVLASGRSDVEIAPVLVDLGLESGHAVCSNGSVTLRHPCQTILDVVTFDARQALSRILRHVPAARIAADRIGLGYDVTAYFPDGELPAPQRLRTLDELIGQPLHHVIVRDVHATADDFAELANRLDLRDVSIAAGDPGWFDLVARGVSKASALDKLASSLRVPAADCLAIGDGRNDIDMLAWAGRGVAMAQAPPEVLSVADSVTGSLEANGVASELVTWFARIT